MYIGFCYIYVVTKNGSVTDFKCIINNTYCDVLSSGTLNTSPISTKYGSISFTSYANGLLKYTYTLTKNAISVTQDTISVYAANSSGSTIKNIVLAKIRDDAPTVSNPSATKFYYKNATVSDL